MFIHRWVPEFVIQGGGFRTEQRHQTNAVVKAVVPFGPITNEYGVGRTFSNLAGTLAMARVSGQTNSATSQWFFNLTNNAFLDTVDGGFTVFGTLLSGMDVLNRFNVVSTNNGIFLLNIGAPLDEMPVLAQHDPGYEDLVYVDITLLQVQVNDLAAGQKEVSWQSVSNKVNHVQFTAQIPPVWEELVRTNGTGQRLQFVDARTRGGQRFYRVVVDY
jgi:cyclophilin family peptidyl-prolyl cis-trans isomerase